MFASLAARETYARKQKMFLPKSKTFFSRTQILRPLHMFSSLTTKKTMLISIYTLSDLGVLSNLIGSLSLANEHYSPPTE